MLDGTDFEGILGVAVRRFTNSEHNETAVVPCRNCRNAGFPLHRAPRTHLQSLITELRVSATARCFFTFRLRRRIQNHMDKNVYAIIGASGNTGHVVASRLMEQGHDVRVIGRSADRLHPLVKRGAEAAVANVTDSEALARAFSGARGVYALLPPEMAVPDYRAHQNRISDAITTALMQSRVPYVVVLSSIGADKESGTGPVAGLHYLEQRISSIAGVNALFVRAAYFMENTLPQVQLVRQFGVVGGPLRADLKLPMIATCDIGAFAAEHLLKLDFRGHETRELLGHADLTMTEVASIIGKAVAKRDLNYVQLPDEQVRTFFVQAGAAPKTADLMLEMAAALNSGHMRALESRSPANTTPTSFDSFVEDFFVPAYQVSTAA